MTSDGKQNDSEMLAGVWLCTSATNDGRAMPEEIARELRLTLTPEGGYKTERAGQVLFDSSYSIDAGRTPKQIDMIGTEGDLRGKSAQGIYSLGGDTLTICYTMPGRVRPTAFESAPGSKATLAVWKRAGSVAAP